MKDRVYAKWRNKKITPEFRSDFEKLAAHVQKDFKESIDMNTRLYMNDNCDIVFSTGYISSSTQELVDVCALIMIYGGSNIIHYNGNLIKNTIVYYAISMLLHKHKYMKVDFEDFDELMFQEAQVQLTSLGLI